MPRLAGFPHLLLVDDDRRLRDLIGRFLTREQHVVIPAPDASAARRLLERLAVDVAVVDGMMPGEDGLSLARWLVAERDVPVLMLTARNETSDRIAGLEAGIDDYLAKPFEPRELVLRLAAILRRTGFAGSMARQFGGWRFEPDRSRLTGEAGSIRLTDAENRLLGVLLGQPDRPISREDLAERAGLGGSARAIDVQITRLRRKIEQDPKLPRHLMTVRGEGYVFRPG